MEMAMRGYGKASEALLNDNSWRDTLRQPDADWAGPGFEDASWTAAPGGFGSPGKAGAVVRTEWRTADIWLRRVVTIAPGVDAAKLALSIHHDEDAEVFLNGVLAARVEGFVNDYGAEPILAAARSSLRPGPNVLAVHCRQTRGGQYIDLGIVETIAAPPRGPAHHDGSQASGPPGGPERCGPRPAGRFAAPAEVRLDGHLPVRPGQLLRPGRPGPV